MVSRSAGSGLFVTRAQGGGEAPGTAGPRLPAVVTEDPVVTSGATRATATLGATVRTNGFATAVFWRVRTPASDLTGFIVGGQSTQDGGIVSTVDEGVTWARDTIPSTPPTLYGVAIMDGDSALAVGYGGTVLRLTAAGADWDDITTLVQPPDPTVLVPLLDVDSDGDQTAWLGGLFGTLRKTADLGDTWTNQLSAGVWRMRDVHFISASVGWSVATQEAVLVTADGGVTWAEENLGALGSESLNGIKFRDATHGVAVGSGLKILYYSAGTWLVATVPALNATLNSVAWADFGGATDAWAVGTNRAVLRSTDASGTTWSSFTSPPFPAGVELTSIAYDGTDTLWVVGCDRTNGLAHAARLQYPGLVWEDLSISAPGAWESVAALGTEVYATGASDFLNGVIYQFDGGASWDIVQTSTELLSTSAISGAGAGRVFLAGGERGKVYRFKYSTSTWDSPKSATSISLTGMSMISGTQGFAVGKFSLDAQGVPYGGGVGAVADSAVVVYDSVTGFAHRWGGQVGRVFVYSATKAWTAEDGGRIRHTSNGTTWAVQTTPAQITTFVRGIYFLKTGAGAGTTGWAVGANGYLIKTTNSGTTWSVVGGQFLYPAGHRDAGEVVDLWDVVFLEDGNQGWVCGIGALLRTEDGGATWVDLGFNLDDNQELYRFSFIGIPSGLPAHVIGEPGAVYSSIDGDTWSLQTIPNFIASASSLELWDIAFQRTVTTPFSIGTGIVTVPESEQSVFVTFDLAGLALSTEYLVRAFAFHSDPDSPFSGQTVSGDEVTFSTGVAATAPPVAVTIPATQIGATSATLNGRINPAGTDTDAWFELTGPNGLEETAHQAMGSGSVQVGLIEFVSDLVPDSDYSVQAIAQNVTGQRSVGLPLQFHTEAATGPSAPTLISMTISQVASTTALATVSYDTGGPLCSVSVILDGPPGSAGVIVPAGSTTVDIPIATLTPATAYVATPTISNHFGTDFGDDVLFTTSGAGNSPTGDTSLPDAINQNFASVHALINPHGESTGVTFQYWRDDEPQTVLTEISLVVSAASTETDFGARITNLQPFTVYAYRPVATNGSGTIIGRVIKFKTAGGTPGVAPAVTTTTPATFITNNSATITGTIDDFVVSVTSYFEFWITGQDKKFTPSVFLEYGLVGVGGGAHTVSEPLTGLTAGATYNFRLMAVTAGGQSIVPGTTRTVTTAAAPATPAATALLISVLPALSTQLSCRSNFLDTNGEDTSIFYQASLTADFAAIAGVSPTEVVTDPAAPGLYGGTITGLATATRYYVRLKMTHAVGPVVSYSNTIGPTQTSSILAPTVTTDSLGSATQFTLTAKATVTIPTNVGGGDVFAWFEYGLTSRPTTEGYDSVSPEINLGLLAGAFDLTIQLGGSGAPPPLIPSTNYYARAKARNSIGQVAFGVELGPVSTGSATGGTVPVVQVGPASAVIRNSFNMTGSVETNGSATAVVFQFINVSMGHQFDTGNMVSITADTLLNGSVPQLVGENTGYNSSGGHAWAYRIKATNAVGSATSPVQQVPGVIASAFTVQPIQNIGTRLTATHVGFQDSTSARISMWAKHDPFGRIWVQMIWGTASDLSTFTASRMMSFNATPSEPPVAPEYLEFHYADYLTGLAPDTDYFYRLRCWSSGGDHIGAIGTFHTDLAAKWSANWVASVGTRLPIGNVMTFIPQNLRLGTGTISRATSPTDTAHDCDMGATVGPDAAELAFSIFVTPTGITAGTGYTAAHGGNAFPDIVKADHLTGSNVAYAIRFGAVGDKIWVDGSPRGMLYRWENGGLLTGSFPPGTIVRNASSTWTGMVTYISNVSDNLSTPNADETDKGIAILLLTGTLPDSGVPGSAAENILKVSAPTTNFITGVEKVYEGAYFYKGVDIGGSGGTPTSPPTSSEGVWRSSGIYYPVTGLRILALDPAFKPVLGQSSLQREHGGVNGVFFKNIDFSRGITSDNYCIAGHGLGGAGGGGVVGFYDCGFSGIDIDGSLGNRGIKTHIKGDAPHTWDIRRCTFSPAQEHSLYGESWGEVNPQDMFISDSRTAGTNWDGSKDFNGRTFCQLTSRGDHWQNAGTGSGYPPGRGNLYLDRNDAVTDSADGGQGFSFWGFHGTIHCTDCRYLGSNSFNSVDSGGFLTQMDTGKGGWFNLHGFAVNALNMTRWANNVDNAADPQIQINSTEVVTITDFFLTMNNKVAFQLLGPNSSFDNGRIRFVLTLGTAILTTYVDAASPRTFGWDPAVNWSNRMTHQGTPISGGTTTPTNPLAVNAFQEGVQYFAVI